MKLKTSLQVSAVFPITLAILVSLSLILRSRQVGEAPGNADLFFAAFIGVMGLLMAVATLSVSRDVVHRLARLSQWARTVSSGKFDAKLDVPANNDEVGDVTRVVLEMTQKLGTAYAAMATEISEHKRVADALRESNILLSNALDKLKRAQYQIIQQERLHVLEQIVRGVAHDFNNTLTPILGMSDFMIGYPQSLAQPEQVLSNLKDINEAARRAKNDVRKLSEFFRPTKGSDFRAVDMNALITDVILLTEPRWKGRGRVSTGPITVRSEPGQVPPVAGDPAELREVLTNLVLNAVEALPKGGQITVSTRRADAMVLVEVSDNGEGMTTEVLDRCCEPFFSTKGVEGTGMGLTVVNNAVQRHGGTREIQSQKGKGTTVSIKLPVWKETGPVAVEDAGLPTVTRELRILVIDDESWSRDIVSKLLVTEKHRVHIAANGREGLAMAESGSYDLVITDRAMPDMSGDEVALAIRGRSPQMPIILLTGFGDIMREEGENPEGVDVILSKPITLSDLSAAVSRATRTKR